ncbi:P-loop containing nucleoside triphosphate hydrolase protein [Dichotomopilus funicola]|uniref:P-loop containing nucleoside triphosphate hydrolase protein n=1 Tax=Dichotomopilus funicola TaxID=1934379 RepID=A0AAN6UZI5_9PEZI|nr:P-loop containing nucleoside triphosphate hydrolase protein [Dichotomopilus funicola]
MASASNQRPGSWPTKGSTSSDHSSNQDGHSIINLDNLSKPTHQETARSSALSTSKSTFLHLFTFTPRQHIPLLLLSLTTSALVAAGRTAYAVFLGKFFQVVTSFGAGTLSSDEFLGEIGQWSVWMCVLGVGMWVASTVDVMCWVTGGEMRAREVRERVFAAVLGMRMGCLEGREEGVGGLAAGVAAQTHDLQTATSQTLGHLTTDVFIFLACLSVAFAYSYKLTLVMLSTAIPSALILYTLARLLDPAIAAQKRELAQAAKQVTAATTAIDLVKVYNAADYETFQFNAAIRRSARHYLRQVLCNCAQMGYVKLWMVMLFVLGFYFAVFLVRAGEMTAGDGLTTFYAALNAFQAVGGFGPHWLVIAKGMAAGRWLRGLAREGEEGEQRMGGWVRPEGCRGEVVMRDISFTYPSNPPNKPTIHPSTFHFPPGRPTFIVGASGSGKSTLGNLLIRLHDPRSGLITLDDRPLTSLDLTWLRQNVTLIQQSSSLFDATFFDNIALGALDPDTVSAASVHEAASMALLQSTIASLPDGIHTHLTSSGSSGGHNLSGGQKQRLALARARLRDPPVLILDEITSALDPVSSALVMEAIRLWRRGKTTIVVTHDVGGIEEGEYIYVMKEGRVVQEGERGVVAQEVGGVFRVLESGGNDGKSRVEWGSDSEVEEDVDGDCYVDPVEEAQYGQFLRGSLVNNRSVSVGLLGRFSFMAEPNIMATPLGRSASYRDRRVSTSVEGKPVPRRSSRVPSIQVIAQRGLDVQRSRTPNARQALRQKGMDVESQVAMESLENFFLERPAKANKNSTKTKTTKSPTEQLPSLLTILRTVWPTLDATGRLQFTLGLLSCLLMALSTPVFSYFFANLLNQFWAPPTGSSQAQTSKYAAILSTIALIDATSTFSAYYLLSLTAQQWTNTLRAEALSRILSQPKSWFSSSNHSPARITQCLNHNAEEMRKLVCLFLPIVLVVITMIISALAWALLIRWDLTLVTLAGVPVAFAAARLNARVSETWEGKCEDAVSTGTGAVMGEVLGNMGVIRALTLESHFRGKHAAAAKATLRVGLKRAGRVGVFYGLHQSVSFFVAALVFWYGARILSQGLVSVVDVVRVMNLLLFSLGTSVGMLGNIPQIAAAKTMAVQMLYFANLSYTASHEAKGGKRLATPLPVRMSNLRFAYPGTPGTPQRQVLRNVNLQVRAGECTAIVGASGCGKSTIASLLLRLYDPLPADTTANPNPFFSSPPDNNHNNKDKNNNSISPIAEHPTTDHPLTYASHPPSFLHTPSLRSHIAYVPQTPFLFPTTIRQNILYGLPETDQLYHDEANLHWAARMAGIHEFVIGLEGGYDTILGGSTPPSHSGEGGGRGGAVANVSGGQAQRICIARALVRRPKLLVMDEPTSALDGESARGVRGVLRGLVDPVVVITHSKEMMRLADRVVMVEDGVVVEEGGYEELVGRVGGKFAGLVGGGVWEGGEREKRDGKGKGKGKERKGVEGRREDALRRLEGGGVV